MNSEQREAIEEAMRSACDLYGICLSSFGYNVCPAADDFMRFRDVEVTALSDDGEEIRSWSIIYVGEGAHHLKCTREIAYIATMYELSSRMLSGRAKMHLGKGAFLFDQFLKRALPYPE